MPSAVVPRDAAAEGFGIDRERFAPRAARAEPETHFCRERSRWRTWRRTTHSLITLLAAGVRRRSGAHPGRTGPSLWLARRGWRTPRGPRHAAAAAGLRPPRLGRGRHAHFGCCAAGAAVQQCARAPGRPKGSVVHGFGLYPAGPLPRWGVVGTHPSGPGLHPHHHHPQPHNNDTLGCCGVRRHWGLPGRHERGAGRAAALFAWIASIIPAGSPSELRAVAGQPFLDGPHEHCTLLQ